MLSNSRPDSCGVPEWVWTDGPGFSLCVAPPHDRIVSNFGVTEFTEFTKGIPEYSGEDGEDGVD